MIAETWDITGVTVHMYSQTLQITNTTFREAEIGFKKKE